METNYIHEDVPGGVPVKMWTRGVPVEDAGQAPADQRRAPADRLQAHRGDARRALRHRRDRRLGDSDAQGHHPGRGGRGHRLRHDRREDHAARRRPARQPGAAALGDRARGAARPQAGRARPGRVEQGAGLGEHGLGAARARVHRAVPRLPEAGEDQPHPAPGHAGHRATTSSRSASTKQGFVWFMLHSGSRGVGNFIGTMFIELAKQDAMRNNVQPARPRPGVLRGRRAPLRRLRARGRLGAEVRAPSTAR